MAYCVVPLIVPNEISTASSQLSFAGIRVGWRGGGMSSTGGAVEGEAVVGRAVVAGARVTGGAVEGEAVFGRTVFGAQVTGGTVKGEAVVGRAVIGAAVTGRVVIDAGSDAGGIELGTKVVMKGLIQFSMVFTTFRT